MSKPIGIIGLAGSGKDTFCEVLLKSPHFKNYTRYAFADPLKQFCMNVFGLTYDQCYDNKLKEVEVVFRITTEDLFTQFIGAIDYLDNLYGMYSGRTIIQEKTNLYYNMMRVLETEIDNDPWYKKFFCAMLAGDYIKFKTTPRKILQLIGTEFFRDCIAKDFWVAIAPKENIIVPDVRYENEAKSILDNSGVILKIHDPALVDIATTHHISEKFAREFDQYDLVIKNDKTKGIEYLENYIQSVRALLQ